MKSECKDVRIHIFLDGNDQRVYRVVERKWIFFWVTINSQYFNTEYRNLDKAMATACARQEMIDRDRFNARARKRKYVSERKVTY